MTAAGRHTRRAMRAERRRQRCADLHELGAGMARAGIALPSWAWGLSRRDRRCLRAGHQEATTH